MNQIALISLIFLTDLSYKKKILISKLKKKKRMWNFVSFASSGLPRFYCSACTSLLNKESNN